MGLIRTYVDAGVLIAAARALGQVSERAIAVLDDSNREFVASDYLRLEVIPKAKFYGSYAEVTLYEEYFSVAQFVIGLDSAHMQRAFELGCQYGLSAFDALHLVAATEGACEEFVTSEKVTSPIFRFRGISLKSIA